SQPSSQPTKSTSQPSSEPSSPTQTPSVEPTKLADVLSTNDNSIFMKIVYVVSAFALYII
ncbi:unnamed protein product, partial [Sphagnum compactum]